MWYRYDHKSREYGECIMYDINMRNPTIASRLLQHPTSEQPRILISQLNTLLIRLVSTKLSTGSPTAQGIRKRA